MLESVNKRHVLILAGDFNAKTGSGHEKYPRNIGKFGKGNVNENGEHLLQLAARQDLVLTNTLFDHKQAHRTTWTCPERKVCDKNGSVRRNPYRNQIDYIIVRTNFRSQINNSRSYGGHITKSDHKLVICETVQNFKWHQVYKDKRDHNKLDIYKLRDRDIKLEYQKRVCDKLSSPEISDNTSDINPTQAQWNNIVTACIESAKSCLASSKDYNTRKDFDPVIKELSEKQHQLRLDIESSTNSEKRKEIKAKRNKILKEIHQRKRRQKMRKS